MLNINAKLCVEINDNLVKVTLYKKIFGETVIADVEHRIFNNIILNNHLRYLQYRHTCNSLQPIN